MIDDRHENRPYRTLAAVRELVDAFESGTLPREAWNHRAHLAVAMWYMTRHEESLATERMIQGIRSYNRAQRIRQTATSGYHETITLVWLALARYELSRMPADGLAAINSFVMRYHSRGDVLFDYYSRGVLFSEKARSFWVEPDLKQLPRRSGYDPVPDRASRIVASRAWS